MAKMNQVYGIGQALIPSLPPPIPFQNAPTSNQTNYEIGQIAYTPVRNPTSFYIYAGGGTWSLFGSSSGDVVAVVGTASQVSVSTVAGTATVSLPSAITTPGSLTTTTSLAATTTVTAGTGLTVTTGNAVVSAGNITATLGNIAATAGSVSAGTGSGLVLTPVVVGAGASPQTANGRVFSVTFSGVSIAAGATQSFVIDNTAVNTLAQISMLGATTGAALNIQSITYSANTSITIVVENGTGATTSTGNITFTGFCIN